MNIIKRLTNLECNILTAPTHEAYQTNMDKCDAKFYMIEHPSFKKWISTYRQMPPNHSIIRNVPLHLEMNMVLSQNKFGQFQVLSQYAKQLQLPLISLEHTLPMPSWPTDHLLKMKQLNGHLNVFISEYSRKKWLYNEDEGIVVHHGIDTNTFKNYNVERQPYLLSVVNDWINRDWCCGYKFWAQAVNNMDVKVFGDTPGLSKPTQSIEHLVSELNNAQVFVNTSLISPVPTALLEAMSCGCAVVSTNNCMIPEIIENGRNGYLCDTPEEMNKICKYLLGDAKECARLGAEARQTIINKFSLEKFVENWNIVFQKVQQL